MQQVFTRLAKKNPVVALVVAVVLVVCLVLGWVGSGSVTGETGVDAPASQSTAGDATLQSVQIVRVVDGDTMKAQLPDGTVDFVRLVGIDTPESVAKEESRNCEEGIIASNYTKSLLSPGQTVWIQRDVSDTDQYGRLLRYVWLEKPNDPFSEDEIAKKMLNAVLVREGYAQVKRYRPDTTLYELFKQWGNQAVDEDKGVTRKWA